MAATHRSIQRYSISIGLLLLAVAGQVAHGDIVVSIERIGDTKAIISGMGTVGTFDNLGGRAVFRFIDGPLAGALPPSTTSHTLSDNTLVIGSTSLTDASTLVNSPAVPDNFYLRMSVQPADGSAISGSVEVDLNAQVWAPVGTSGAVNWGNDTNQVGVWSIVAPTAIPEPSSVPLLVGLASVVAARHKRRRREPSGATIVV